VCNGMFFGGGVKISPLSKMTDGKLEMIATQAIPKWGLLGLVPKIYSGSHLSHPKVLFKSDSTFVVTLKKPQLLETDGEVQGFIEEVTFSVCPSALRVLCD